MSTDVHAAAQFYASPLGAVTARLLRAQLRQMWPDMAGRSLLGLGYAMPYLRLWRGEAARTIAAIPEQLGAAKWPAGAPCLACTVEEESLPFADCSFDRILLVHGLENAENARRMLREIWRVLTEDGRLLVVTPNRMGLWAHFESTPFGHGQPFTPGQIGRLLASSLFRVERRAPALFLPPVHRRLVLRSARLWERAGLRSTPNLAGLTLTEAVKDVYAGLPARKVARRRLILADAA